ncbi:DUF4268 domain-containing protein [Janibacter terrae]|uniref:DUF4268 domain-containing protein n=1 Tax=Janibacter terrae TaxID=103817 RepID=UPI0031F9702F
METFKRTPLEMLGLPQHFVIPLFQRPYVWKKDEQWDPLWKDIQRVTELRMTQPHLAPQHFLGAVVLQSQPPQGNKIPAWNVVDGQQRITTLQLLMDATHSILSSAGLTRLANQLESLTHNSADFMREGESLLKLRHLNDDRSAFDEVMTAEAPIDHESLDHADSLIVKAHHYFVTVVSQWLGEPDTDEFPARAEELTDVLKGGLTLVSIELLASENSQEIFETLNARGTPLTAADLVRNYVFQRVEAEGGDAQKVYKEDWPFEKKFWTKEVSVGRYFVSRSSLFLNQWLMSQLGEEISPQATFARFKSYVEHHTDHQMTDLLPLIKEQAGQYQAWTEAASRPSGVLSVVEMSTYRMQAGGIELLKPLLLWLHAPGRNVPQDVIDEVVSVAESWIVRRQFLRMTTSDLGRIIADIIQANQGTPPDELGERVTAHLARLNVTSTYWPGDDEIRQALSTEAVYRRFPRARLRTFLEAIENHYRAETGQPQVERIGYPIEHILPRKWQDSWPVDTPEGELERQERVNRLGNLTLLTTSLNSKVSNGPWASKRTALLKHNTLKITGRLVDSVGESDWDEDRIDARTSDLIDVLLRVWPVPSGHIGKVVDPQTKAGDWVELKHLVEGGLLEVGDTLAATHRDFVGREAVIGEDCLIHLNGKVFDTPSGAARHLRQRATNGWYFWSVADGRRLRDVRQEFLGGAQPVGTVARANLYREFWELTLERMRAEHPTWTRGTTSNASWIDASVGTSGVVVSSAWTTSGLEAQLYLNSPDADLNSERYQTLFARRDEFEAQLDLIPRWDPMEGRKASRVALTSSFSAVEDRDSWEDAVDWLISAQAQLRKAYYTVTN